MTKVRGASVDWVEGELKKEEEPASVQPETQPATTLARWYEGLRSRLEQDVKEFNQHRGGAAEVSVEQQRVFVVNAEAAVQGTFTVDLDLQQVRSEYMALRGDVAVPEGEIFTLRFEDGRVAVFSADQEISEEALRQELLRPVLFPEEP